MITRHFTFTPDPTGRADFRIAYEAFRSRDPQKAKDERKLLAELQRALTPISEPIGDLPKQEDLDIRLRRLNPAGGAISISQKAFEKLETLVAEALFSSGVSADVEDFLDRWGTAEKHDTKVEA